MIGIITTKDLLFQSRLIVREFGTRCFLRCLWRNVIDHGAVTFLECVEPLHHLPKGMR